MIYIIKNKQVYFLILLSIIVGLFMANGTRSNFLEIYMGRLGIISIRYFLIILSIIIEYVIYKTMSNSCIISRHESKQIFLKKSIKLELLLSIIIFSIFNLVVMLFSLPTSIHYIIDIVIITINIMIIYITISLTIKVIDIFAKNHYVSSIIFVFLYTAFDFILEYFNFFFFNNKLFDLETIYKVFYIYKNSIIYLLFILMLDLIMFTVLNLKIRRKDFILKNDEEI